MEKRFLELLARITVHPALKEHPIYPLLGRRERDVLKLLVKGYSSKQIAEELFLSESTINKHREYIYRKANVRGCQEIRLFLHEMHDLLQKVK